jgi:hypothetical protein
LEIKSTGNPKEGEDFSVENFDFFRGGGTGFGAAP